MKYYKFTAGTPYRGTEKDYYIAYEDIPTESDLDLQAEELQQEIANSYEYLVHGWAVNPVEEGEMTQVEYDESIESYYADCYCIWEEVTKEEYEENA